MLKQTENTQKGVERGLQRERARDQPLRLTPISKKMLTNLACRATKKSGWPTRSGNPRALGADAPPPPPMRLVKPLPPVRKLLPPDKPEDRGPIESMAETGDGCERPPDERWALEPVGDASAARSASASASFWIQMASSWKALETLANVLTALVSRYVLKARKAYMRLCPRAWTSGIRKM